MEISYTCPTLLPMAGRKRGIRRFALLLLAIVALLVAQYVPGEAYSRVPGSVVRVVDGDTLVLQLATRKKPTTVRLIGLNAPESKVSAHAHQMAKRSKRDVSVILRMGAQATKFLESVAKPGTKVELEYGQTRYDKYKRTLGYVYLLDGTMLNELVLREGYALPTTYSDNTRYALRLRAAAEEAQRKGRGLWRW